MKGILKPIEMFNIISKSLKDFDKNLKNKNVMFIMENKDRTIDKEETFFPKSCFYHLTGVNIYNKDGKKVNSYEFYELIKDERFSFTDYKIKNKNLTTDLKLQILPQLVQIDKTASMFGNYIGNNIFLQTEKVAGNVNACLGFVKGTNNKYVPNTALKEDIRNITGNNSRVVAILKKELNEKFYKNITYLKNNYEIKNLLKNENINKNIDTKNLYSENCLISEKILKVL